MSGLRVGILATCVYGLLLFAVICGIPGSACIAQQPTTSSAQSPTTRHAIASSFQSHLQNFRDLTWRDYEASLRDRPNELDGIDFDPGRSDYFGLVKRELGLTESDVDLLRRNGFVMKGCRQKLSFPGAYYNIYTRDLPLLVTTDSILHAFHHSYDKILLEIEARAFVPTLERMLSDVHAQLAHYFGRESNDELAVAAHDVDFYLVVARRLLGDSDAVPIVEGTDQLAAVDEMVRFIHSSGEVARVNMYGGQRQIDFTQFRARGHYTKSAQLSNYFGCMMWLGRADCGWTLDPPHPATGVKAVATREVRAATLLTQLFKQAGHIETWSELDRALSFLVGKSDNLNVSDLLAVSERCGITSVADLEERDRVGHLQEQLAGMREGEQVVRSQVLGPNHGSPASVPMPRVFQVFGQRFALDSFILSQVVHDSIEFQGRPMRRMMPKGFDVMAGLGNELAVQCLEPELGRWNYSGNLAALQKTIDELPQAYWTENMYTGWLNAIRQLDRDTTDETMLPQVFRTEAWRRKQLQTQLASWSELRHDTILYTKASYAVPACEFPKAYVEPYPEMYRSVAQLARRAANDLAPFSRAKPEPKTGFWGGGGIANDVSIVEFFERMSRHLDQLGTIAEKQLRGDQLTEEETLFLQRTISQKGNVLVGSGGANVKTYDGWYPQIMYGFMEENQDLWQATVADVHTDVQNGQVLEVGVGPLEMCVIAVEEDDQTRLYVGPTYSYYEFHQSMSDRMTDRQWNDIFENGDVPERPSFVASLLGTDDTQLEPLVQTFREHDYLTVIVDRRSIASGIPGDHLIHISKEGLTRLAEAVPGARHLDLSSCQLEDDDMQPLQSLYNLKAVDLSDTKITGQTLAVLGDSKFLRRLSLRNTCIDDQALELIAQWPYLDTLDLRGTQVTDEGLKHLHGQRYLRQVLVDRQAITDQAVKALLDALPECKVD